LDIFTESDAHTMKAQESVTAPSTSHTETRDIATRITNRIVSLLEQGVVPWRRTWGQKRVTHCPRSAGTGKAYQGINALHLSAITWSENYASPTFITFQEAKKRGGSVRKGEHGYPVIYWKMIDVDSDTGDSKKIPMLRHSTVFNVAQCDGLPDTSEPVAVFTPIDTAEDIWRRWADKPSLIHGGMKAAYNSVQDVIRMPYPVAFDPPEEYYTTLFHEAIHATGHPKRLCRDMSGSFGSQKYGREELVAEMGATMLCAYAGIEDEVIENSAGYLDGWIKTLKGDKRLLIVASGQAEKAVHFIRQTKPDEPAPDNWQETE
jgi:antirestriction protein ArdC